MLIDGLKLREGSVNANIVIPSMTSAQRNALTQPDRGELAYVTDGTIGLYVFTGAVWRQLDNFSASNINSGTLAIAYGGTGRTTATAALSALGGATATHTHADKQNLLISGVNIKTVNGGTSLLGSGDISIASFTLEPASETTLGGVYVDGVTITASPEGVISSNGGYMLPTASTGSLGGVIVDGTTIVINDGVISADPHKIVKYVELATTANITLSGLQTIDNVSAVDGYKVLVKNQTNAAENGIYSVVSNGAWTRTFDTGTLPDIVDSFIIVKQGNNNTATAWVSSTSAMGILDVDSITWSQISGNSSNAGGWVYLSTVTANSATTADIETTFNSTYDMYVIVATGVYGSANAATQARMKLAGSYVTSTSYNYSVSAATSAYVSLSASNDTQITMTSVGTPNSTTSQNFVMYVPKPSSTMTKQMFWTGADVVNGANTSGFGSNNANTALTGIRFYRSSGTITGTFRLYGIKNS